MTTPTHPPFTIGEIVYVVYASSTGSKLVPCPLCAKTKRVTVVFGSGEVVRLDCQFCDLTGMGSTGNAAQYGPKSEVVETLVVGVRLGAEEHWTVEVGHKAGAWLPADQVWADKDDAERHRAELYDEMAAEASTRWRRKVDNARKGKSGLKAMWDIGIHKIAIEELKERITWHENEIASRWSSSDDAGFPEPATPADGSES